MKKIISVLMAFVIGLSFLVIFNISSSLASPVDESTARIDSGLVSSGVTTLSINSLNDSVKQLSNDGTNILNTINQVKSNLKNGEVAIDIIINNPNGASVKDVIGVRISFDSYILENFDITSMSATKGEGTFNSENNEVEWVIPKILTNETVTLSYKLKLKSKVSRSILNKRLKTNRQIIVTEWGNVIGTYPENSQIDTQICSPTIRIITEEGELSISKTVTGEGADTNKLFNFTVTLSDRNINGTYGDITFTNGVANIKLKHGQTMTASNLPSNITYSVVELEANIDNYVTSSTDEAGTIKSGITSHASFVNTYKKQVGNLSVKKIVSGSAGDVNKNFNFTVTLSDKNINGTYGDLTFTNGVSSFNLKHNAVKVIRGLPINIQYVVEEVDANTDGYLTIYDDGNSNRTNSKVTGTIIENSNKVITVYNTKENNNFITVNKQFNTTSNFQKDVEVSYASFKNNGISLEEYKKYVANKKITLLATNGSTHTSLEVSTNENGSFVIPSNYSSLYKEYKVDVELPEGILGLTINCDKNVPIIPNSLSFHLTARDKSSGTNLEKDFILTASENYMKSILIESSGANLENIKITETSGNTDWEFSYKTEINGNNISVIMNNKAGKYVVTGNLVLTRTPSKKITIEKFWQINENYIDIYFTSEERDNFEIDVKIIDKKDKVLETVKLDKTGHGVSTKKYSSDEELYVLYPDGKKVKVSSDSVSIPNEVKIKVGNDVYVLTKGNDWNMVINKDYGSDVLVEEVSSVLGFSSSIDKLKDDKGNFEIKIINTRLSSRNATYNEIKVPIKNPDTGINSYFVVGIVMILFATCGLIFYKKRIFFK